MSLDRIRAFNRFYTGKIGLITNRFLKSDFSLVQARLLFELSRTGPVYAADLARELGLAPDYLSKSMAAFEARGLISRTPSPSDARKQVLRLTRAGEAAYASLREQSDRHIKTMIRDLSPEELADLQHAMDSIRRLLDRESHRQPLVTLRSHRPGDIGWVIHRHGVLYAREYGFNHEFDAYVAQGMAAFVQNYDPDREHLWLAEVDGRFAGSVAIVRLDDRTAQLRWLIVEPRERRKGIGKHLVSQVVDFAGEAGYGRIILWTIDFLHSARTLYADAGFILKETKTSKVWGHTLEEECWEFRING